MPSAPRKARIASSSSVPATKTANAILTSPASGASPASGLHKANDLAKRIRERITKRLGDRIRDLQVVVQTGKVVLRGSCATYYSKQLAQHAALGVIEDEHLENVIEVSPPN